MQSVSDTAVVVLSGGLFVVFLIGAVAAYAVMGYPRKDASPEEKAVRGAWAMFACRWRDAALVLAAGLAFGLVVRIIVLTIMHPGEFPATQTPDAINNSLNWARLSIYLQTTAIFVSVVIAIYAVNRLLPTVGSDGVIRREASMDTQPKERHAGFSGTREPS